MYVNGVDISVVEADAREIETDLLILKHMRNADGVGKAVGDRLELDTRWESTDLPERGEYELFTRKLTLSKIGAQSVLYLGVSPAPKFRYEDIRRFVRRSFSIAAREAPTTRSATLTLHGPGTG